MGVLGAYGTAIAVVMVSVCVTVFTTTEKPGKQNLEPIGKSSEQSTRISNNVACTKDLLLIIRFIFVTFLLSQVVFRFFVVFGSHLKVKKNHNVVFILAIFNEKKKTPMIF